jgi:hypothetical protein
MLHGRECITMLVHVNTPISRASGPPAGLIGARVQDLDDTQPDRRQAVTSPRHAYRQPPSRPTAAAAPPAPQASLYPLGD